jgi:hypothetical protein
VGDGGARDRCPAGGGMSIIVRTGNNADYA